MEKKEKDGEVQLYHYLDEEGLDLLYAQCGQFLVESLITVEKAGEIDGSTEVEIGKLLSMVGLGSVKLDGHVSLNRLKSESLKSVFRVEQRIPLVLGYLRAQGQLCELTQAGAVIEEDGYVLIENEFLTPNFKEVLEKAKANDMWMFAAFFGDRNSIKREGFVQFTSQVSSGRVTMGTSLNKYQTGLQHLMLMWESAEGERRKVRLRVLGYLTRKSEKDYYLKPFAVAQAK